MNNKGLYKTKGFIFWETPGIGQEKNPWSVIIIKWGHTARKKRRKNLKRKSKLTPRCMARTYVSSVTTVYPLMFTRSYNVLTKSLSVGETVSCSLPMQFSTR